MGDVEDIANLGDSFKNRLVAALETDQAKPSRQ